MSLTSLLEERLAVDALELDLAAFEAFEQLVLVGVGELGERLAGVVGAAIAVERGEAVAIYFGDVAFRLRAVILGRLHERRAVVETGILAVGAGQLPVEIDGAAGVLAAGGFRIGRDDAVGDRLDGAAFIGVEKMPRTGLDGERAADRRRWVPRAAPRAERQRGQRRPTRRRGRYPPADLVGAEALENRRTRADPAAQRLSFCNVPRAGLRQMRLPGHRALRGVSLRRFARRATGNP